MKNIPVNTPLLIGNEKNIYLNVSKQVLFHLQETMFGNLKKNLQSLLEKNMQFLSQVELWLFKLLMNV